MYLLPGLMSNACNLSTWEAEAGPLSIPPQKEYLFPISILKKVGEIKQVQES
jgi:hypothetical protein